MRTIKFETIKRKALDEVRNRLSTAIAGFPGDPLFLAIHEAIKEKKNPRVVLTEWQDKVEAIVRQWDVRMVAGLIKAFPAIVPASCRTTKITCDYDEAGGWVVMFH